GDAQHLGAAGGVSAQPDPGRPAPGDLDVGPADAPPADTHRLHHRLFAGEAGGETAGGVGEPQGVFPLVGGEAAFQKARVFAVHRLDAVDVGQVDTESDD